MEFNTLLSDSATNLAQNKYFIGLIVLVIFDYITALAKVYVWHALDSSIGRKGLTKHAFTLVGIALMWSFCDAYQATILAFAVTGLYSANYTLSILENLGAMGVYVPKGFAMRIAEQKQEYEDRINKALNVTSDSPPNVEGEPLTIRGSELSESMADSKESKNKEE